MINNLLNVALSVITPQTIQYQKYIGTTINELGFDVPEYEEPITVKGSIQSHISPQAYESYGLTLGKNYRLVNIPANVIAPVQNVSPDRLIFENKTWIVLKCNQWFEYNGWNKLIVIEEKEYNDDIIPPTPPEEPEDNEND